MEQNENVNTQNLNELVNWVCEELRPKITEMMKNVIVENASKSTPETTIENKPVAIEIPEIPEISANVKLMLEKVETLIDEDKKFNKMHNELDEYRKGVYRKILSPILKNIVAQYSKVNDLYTFYVNKQKEENADYAQLFASLLKEYNNLELGLSDLLYEYDVEIVEPQPGEEFNPKQHRAIKTIPANDAAQDRKIAACVTIGFKDVSANDQIIKYPEVEVFKLNQ